MLDATRSFRRLIRPLISIASLASLIWLLGNESAAAAAGTWRNAADLISVTLSGPSEIQPADWCHYEITSLEGLQGGPLTITWLVDGDTVQIGSRYWDGMFGYDPGNHTLEVQVSDSAGFGLDQLQIDQQYWYESCEADAR